MPAEPLAHDDILPRASDARDGMVVLLTRIGGAWRGSVHIASAGTVYTLDVRAASSLAAWQQIRDFVHTHSEEP